MDTEGTFQQMVNSGADVDVETWITILQHDLMDGLPRLSELVCRLVLLFHFFYATHNNIPPSLTTNRLRDASFV